MSRRKPSIALAAVLLALWLVSCGSENPASLFSNVPQKEPVRETPRPIGASGRDAGGGAESQAGGAANGAAGSENAGASSEAEGGAPGSSGASANAGEQSTNGGEANGNAGSSGGEAGAGSGANGGSSSHDSCTSNVECGVGRYCKKLGCFELGGTCQTIPSDCDNEANPVCGCDGFTYFNRCLAEKHGENVASDSACRENAQRCATQAACRAHEDAVCGFVVASENQCSRAGSLLGSCWVLPESCVQSSQLFAEPCGRGNECRDLCDAIRTGDPHHLSSCG